MLLLGDGVVRGWGGVERRWVRAQGGVERGRAGPDWAAASQMDATEGLEPQTSGNSSSCGGGRGVWGGVSMCGVGGGDSCGSLGGND